MHQASYLCALPDVGERYAQPQNPSLSFDIQVSTPGQYTVWARGMAPDLAGDSVHISLNGNHQARLTGFEVQTWSWAKLDIAGGDVAVDLVSGQQTLSLSMAEDGTRIDRLYLTNDGTVPTGQGPAASVYQTSTVTTQETISQTVVYDYDGLYLSTTIRY